MGTTISATGASDPPALLCTNLTNNKRQLSCVGEGGAVEVWDGTTVRGSSHLYLDSSGGNLYLQKETFCAAKLTVLDANLKVKGGKMRIEANSSCQLEFREQKGATDEDAIIRYESGLLLRNKRNTPLVLSTQDTPRLTISGTGKATFAQLPSIPGGTANQVLSTDGAGTLSWATQSGGGGGASLTTANTFTQLQTFSRFWTVPPTLLDVSAGNSVANAVTIPDVPWVICWKQDQNNNDCHVRLPLCTTVGTKIRISTAWCHSVSAEVWVYGPTNSAADTAGVRRVGVVKTNAILSSDSTFARRLKRGETGTWIYMSDFDLNNSPPANMHEHGIFLYPTSHYTPSGGTKTYKDIWWEIQDGN